MSQKKTENELLQNLSIETRELLEGEHQQPTEITQAVANISNLQRRTWNVLAKNFALSVLGHPDQNLETQTMHISWRVLAEAADVKIGYIHELYEQLLKLKRVPLKFITTDPSGNPIIKERPIETNWLATISDEAPHPDGELIYEFSPSVARLLSDPIQVAHFSLPYQRLMKRSRSPNMYEWLSNYKPSNIIWNKERNTLSENIRIIENKTLPNGKKATVGSTWVVTVEHFRLMLEATSKTFDQFKHLKYKIIEPNLSQINETDIYAFYETVKQGRRVNGLEFFVAENDQQPLILDIGKLVETDIYKELTRLGLWPVEAERFIIQKDEDYLWEKIKYTKKELWANKIKKSVGGFLKGAIENNYVDPQQALNFARKEQKEEADQIEHKKRAQEDKLQAENETKVKENIKKEEDEIRAFLESQNKSESDFETQMLESFQTWEREAYQNPNPSRSEKLTALGAKHRFFLDLARQNSSST